MKRLIQFAVIGFAVLASAGSNAQPGMGAGVGPGAPPCGSTLCTVTNLNVVGTAIPANGIYEGAAGELDFSSNSNRRGFFSSGGSFISAASGGFSLSANASSCTAPSLRPNNSGTSYGWSADASPTKICGVVNGADVVDFTATTISFLSGTYNSCTALTTNGSGVLGCTASDPRLKNIDKAKYAFGTDIVSEIAKHDGVISFRGKLGNPENVDTRHQAGFNCWVVEKYLPLGTHRDNRGYCNLDPEAMQGALFNAVAQLASENKTLAARVASLERRR